MTTNNLPAPSSQNTELALKKTKALFELTDRLLAKKPRELTIPEDDSWMYELWAWADENNISGERLPRNKEKLTNLTKLNLYFELKWLTSLPESIGNLTNLTEIHLDGNRLYSLPETIGKLTKLKTIYLYFSPLPRTENDILIKLLPKCEIFHDELDILF